MENEVETFSSRGSMKYCVLLLHVWCLAYMLGKASSNTNERNISFTVSALFLVFFFLLIVPSLCSNSSSSDTY